MKRNEVILSDQTLNIDQPPSIGWQFEENAVIDGEKNRRMEVKSSHAPIPGLGDRNTEILIVRNASGSFFLLVSLFCDISSLPDQSYA